MRTSILIVDRNNRRPSTGYSVKLYAWSSGSSGYTGSVLYTFTDNDNGIYQVDITTTIKGTVVITMPNSTAVVVPNNYKGFLFQGDNQPTLPRATTESTGVGAPVYGEAIYGEDVYQ